MIKQTHIIDEKTGEIHNSKIQFISCAFHEEKGYLFWARKSFSKSFQDVPYPDSMTDLEIGRMARLAKHIWSNTNMLGYRGSGGVRPYDVAGIGSLLGIGERRAQQFIAKMTKTGMLARVEIEAGNNDRQVQFYVNPIYFFSSNRIPLNLYLIFKLQLDEVLPQWVKEKYAMEATNEHAH